VIHSRPRAARLLVVAVAVLAACGNGGEVSALRYVALGDSYTIGTSVAEAERWPNQLVERIDELELAGNPAVNGFTSADLINDELPQLDALRPELASVLIGVNDVVQGVPDSQYAGNVAIILEELLTRLPSNRILCIATPDYTVTPSGAAFGDPAQQSDAIVRFNAILREACEHREVRFVPEIFEISQAALEDPSLVADDGLHPSGKQYSLWIDAIEPVVRDLIED
jgi:acyl-CoA thioesterase I